MLEQQPVARLGVGQPLIDFAQHLVGAFQIAGSLRNALLQFAVQARNLVLCFPAFGDLAHEFLVGGAQLRGTGQCNRLGNQADEHDRRRQRGQCGDGLDHAFQAVNRMPQHPDA